MLQKAGKCEAFTAAEFDRGVRAAYRQSRDCDRLVGADRYRDSTDRRQSADLWPHSQIEVMRVDDRRGEGEADAEAFELDRNGWKTTGCRAAAADRHRKFAPSEEARRLAV